MKEFLVRILQGFEYQSPGEWLGSLAPSYKYGMVPLGIGISVTGSIIETLLGLDALAFMGLMVVMLLELVSGIWASRIRKETFSSKRMSRFTFKCAVYLLLIAVPYLFSQSYDERGKTLAAGVFDWMHVFFTVQIVVENLISILENYAVISGKDKTHWIVKIQNKADQLLS